MHQLNEELKNAIQEIVNARDAFKSKKKQFKIKYPGGRVAVEDRYKTARAGWLEWSHYADCGPSYEFEYQEASELMEEFPRELQTLISSQKFVKKLKHSFATEFPEFIGLLEEELARV